MKRIQISQEGFAVSAPGNDVTAGGDMRNFIFNSDIGAPFGVFMSGSVWTPAFAYQDYTAFEGGDVYWYVYTIAFGKTFTEPPVVFISVEDGQYAGASQTYLYVNSSGGSFVIPKVYVDHVDLYYCYWPSNTVATPPVAVAFAIGQR